jgi:hypothetical protein
VNVEQNQANNSTTAEAFFAGEQQNPNLPPNPDEKAKQEELFFGGDLGDIEVFLKYEKFKLQKLYEDSERKLREKHAKKAFKFSAIWAAFVGLIIMLHASNRYFILKETEFLFVIGSLTASILTYYLLVIKYLFYRKDYNRPPE